MARFDVYPTPLLDERAHTPFWLDVQADHLQALGTRLIVPLRRMQEDVPVKQRLNPVFSVENQPVFADTANIASFPLALLRRPLTSLRDHRLAIDDALDYLFAGF